MIQKFPSTACRLLCSTLIILFLDTSLPSQADQGSETAKPRVQTEAKTGAGSNTPQPTSRSPQNGAHITPSPAAHQKQNWYHTRPIDVSFVNQKQTMRLTADSAVEIFTTRGNQLADKWQSHLPKPVTPAESVETLPATEHLARYQKPKPLKLHVVGFNDEAVRIVIARKVAFYRWHGYYSVEADLMVERSPAIDRLLNLGVFTQPFTREIHGLSYGSSRKEVHEALGPPDAHRFTQAMMLSWDYYFNQDLAIQYQGSVFKILDHVPQPIRNGTTENPHVRYDSPDRHPVPKKVPRKN